MGNDPFYVEAITCDLCGYLNHEDVKYLLDVDANEPSHAIGPTNVTVLGPVRETDPGGCFRVRVGDRNKGKLYVAKVFRPGKAQLEIGAMKTARLAKTDHPGRKHIIDLIATSTLVSDNTNPKDSTEIAFYPFCGGGDLEDLLGAIGLSRRNVPESFVWHVLDGLLSAVSYLSVFLVDTEGQEYHKSGPKPLKALLHADIKPSNVFLKWRDDDPFRTSYPTVLLADFGAAYEMPHGQTSANLPSGPPAKYSPPEYMYPPQSPKGELWGVGAIAYALCHRQAPIETKGGKLSEFDRTTPKKVCQLPKRYSRELNDVLMWILQEDYEARPTPQEAHDRVRPLAQKKVPVFFKELPGCRRRRSKGTSDTKLTEPDKEMKLLEMLRQTVDRSKATRHGCQDELRL